MDNYKDYVAIYERILSRLDCKATEEIESMAVEPFLPCDNGYGGADIPASLYIAFVDGILQKTYPDITTLRERLEHAGLHYLADYYALVPQIELAGKASSLIKRIRGWNCDIYSLVKYLGSTEGREDEFRMERLRKLKEEVSEKIEMYHELSDLFPEYSKEGIEKI